MSDEIFYLIIFIISMFIISKVCNICIKNILLFIVIVILIIYFINKVNTNNISESFTNSVSDLCNIVKNRLTDVVSKTTSKCVKDEKKESRQLINDAVDCYNFSGNEIVTTNNASSWCDLNSVDIDIINKAIEKI
jgi:c-di-AMP phosphodiesterase-like protein